MPHDRNDSSRAVRALLVDDDVELCELLEAAIEGHGIVVDVAHDGIRGLSRALEGKHDLLLIDVMLPGLDGFELLRQVRRQSRVPVIMLTARTAPADHVAGLDAGADDYLPKPFGADVLVAHVRAVLRRTGSPVLRTADAGGGRIGVGPFRLAPGARTAFVDGQAVELTSIEYDILDYLVRAAGRIVPRGELTAVLFQRPASPFDRGLDTHICNLRKKLGSRADAIGTVRGVGYLLRDMAPDTTTPP